MKKLFFLFLALVATTALWAEDFSVGGIYYRILNGSEVEVTYRGTSTGDYSNEYSGSVTIPSTVTYNGTTYSVTSIGTSAFYYCSSLTSVTIGYSVTTIGDGAFYGCSGLTSITIPNSVTSIGWYAFASCDGLTSVTIPNSVTSIGNYAFANCSRLTSIVVEEGNTMYDSRENCNAIIETASNTLITGCKNTIIPNSVTSIGDNAFYDCRSLTSITIPNSVTSIGEAAFASCDGLTSITIPNSVTSIGWGAFYYCSGLTSVTIPNSVTSIGNEAFEGCSGLTYLSIPSSVVYYYEETDEETDEKYWWYNNGFSSILGCYNLKTLIAPASFFCVERNSESEYQYAKEEYFPYLPEKLETLVLNDEELPRFGWDFIERNRKALKTIDLGAITETSIPEEIFRNYFSLETLVLPSQLEYIPYLSIAECMKLQAITIPATVTEIADRAFEDCRSLKSIIFEGEKTSQGAPRRAAASGSSLWRIGSWAFYNCHQLEHLTIPEGVTEIGDAAFYGCTYLQDMTLPSTVQEIGDNGFALCAKLQKIHVRATTPPSIMAKTFFDVNRRIPVYVPEGAVDAYKSDPYWSEFDIQGESKAPSAVENTHSQSPITNSQKLLRNGQLIIIRDGVEYNAMGVEL